MDSAFPFSVPLTPLCLVSYSLWGSSTEQVEWLRKKGVQSASKLSSRVSREGVIAVAVGAKDAVMIEVI